MNIGICATPLNHGEITGVGNYTVNLVEQMNLLDHGGKDITLVNYQHQSRFHNRELIVPSLSPIYREYFWYLELAHRLKAGDIDLLHNSTANITHGNFKVPYVATVMDIIPLIHPEYMSRKTALLWGVFAKGSIRSADHLIAISESTKRDLVKWCGIPEEKVSVIYPGISPIFKKIEFNHAEIEQRYGIREPFVLYVGSIDPRKNVELLIRSMRDVDPKYHLVIAGRMGWNIRTPTENAARYGVTDRVKWLGYISEQDKVKLYNMASCLVFPSKYEGFGLPPAEAMACGCPVVTGCNSSLPEVVGDDGVYFREDNGLALAISLAVEQDRKVISRFSWEDSAKEIMGVYKRVLE